MIKVALLTTDSREHFKDYANPTPYFGTAPEALLEGFKLMPESIEVHVVSCLQRERISSPEKLADNIYYHALHVPNIGWLKTGYQGCIRHVRRKLREIKPEIVHGQGTERDCAVSAVFSGYPNVLTIHGNIAELARIQKAAVGSFHWLQGCLENVCLRRTGGVFCNSAYTRSLVAPRTRKCWLVPNAIRPGFFKPHTSDRQNAMATLLNVGVISPRKRQVELLELAHQMFIEGIAAKWLFVGSCDSASSYGRAFTELMHRAEAYGYAHYNSELPCDDLIKVMDEAHALIHFPYEEAFGLVAPEALARGLFVFASDVGGLRDILMHETSAQLIPNGDFDALRAGITTWLNRSPCDRRHTQQVATLERFTPASVATEHLRIYRSFRRSSTFF